jgi:hypothetical protein
MTNLQASIVIRPTITAIKSTGVTAAYQLPVAPNLIPKFSMLYGSSGAGKINLVYYRKLSLAGATQTIDLTALTDPFGDAVNFARLRFIALLNWSTTDAHVATIGGGSNAYAGAWVTTLKVPAGVSLNGVTLPGVAEFIAMNTTGYASIDATHKNIVVDPGANTFTFDILLAGSSA